MNLITIKFKTEVHYFDSSVYLINPIIS